MEYIINKNNIANSLLGKQAIRNGEKYRLLNFCLVKHIGDETVIFNNLNKKLVVLSAEEAINLNKIPTTDILGLTELIENWFLVPVDHDDCLLADQIFNFSESFKQNDFINSFIILTTTDCNARCFYCYEHGVTKNNMTNQTANDIADFIIKKSKGEDICIKWFGGEPLYNSDVIDIICNKLNSKKINFFGKMTTNGYLFNETNIRKAVKKWNIRYVQISLDGTEEKYNRIKNYIYKDDVNPFKTVTDNIENLLKNNISVGIRLNVSDINRTDMYSLIDYIYDRYSKYKKLNVYAANLFDLDFSRSDEEIKRLNDEYFKIDKLLIQKKLKHNTFDKIIAFDRGCMAQKATSVCISPKGLLGKCEHYSEGEKMYGSIYSDSINLDAINYWHQHVRIPECETCVVYPRCSGISNCPDMSRKCAIAVKPIKYHNLECSVEKKYQEWKNRGAKFEN